MHHLESNTVLERVDNFFRDITPQDKVCIIHDTDPDGICSAVIVAKGIERLRGKKIDLHLPIDKKNYGINKKMFSQLRKKKITKLIICDFSLEHYLTQLNAAAELCSVLVIDHHKIYADISTLPALFYKPQLFSSVEPQQYCTAKLAYDAMTRLVDVSDLDWMAATASIADIATQPWQTWLKQVFKKYKLSFASDLFATPLGQVAEIIQSVGIYNPALSKKSFETLFVARSHLDVRSSKLSHYKKIIDKELLKHEKLFMTKKQASRELFYYELSSPYSIQSSLSTILGLKYPHNTILIVNKNKSFVRISTRRGDGKKPVNLLLEQAIRGFAKSNAGGHVTAAAAGFPRKYLNTFKKRVMNHE